MPPADNPSNVFDDFKNVLQMYFSEDQVKLVMRRMASEHVLITKHLAEITPLALMEITASSRIMMEFFQCVADDKQPSKKLMDRVVEAAKSPAVEDEIKRFLVYRLPTTKTQ